MQEGQFIQRETFSCTMNSWWTALFPTILHWVHLECVTISSHFVQVSIEDTQYLMNTSWLIFKQMIPWNKGMLLQLWNLFLLLFHLSEVLQGHPGLPFNPNSANRSKMSSIFPRYPNWVKMNHLGNIMSPKINCNKIGRYNVIRKLAANYLAVTFHLLISM